jgi:hypothetical protein
VVLPLFGNLYIRIDRQRGYRGRTVNHPRFAPQKASTSRAVDPV